MQEERIKKKSAIEEKLLEKAYLPQKLAMDFHPFYRGKIEILPKCAIRTLNDFSIYYTPGVAQTCRDIQKNPERVYVHTSKWNTVAVVTDGSRVLGLGDIGPEASLPVMEGKALLFKYLGGVDAFPICLDTKDPELFINTVKRLQPSFGGINLEDIANPKCFYILDRLCKEMQIPVWHDDQQGTAAVILAGVINALKIVGKKQQDILISFIGAGSANIATIRVLSKAGFPLKNMIVVDSKGILHKGRKDIEALKKKYPQKWQLCLKTNYEERTGSSAESLKDVDLCIAASKSGPGVIKQKWITTMANDAILFSMANPVPEIWPWEAKEAGALIVATGRSDFPNQVNNSLGFPGIFRGVLDVQGKTITDEMCIAAANELAQCAQDKGINEEYLIPTMEEWELYPREAVAVGMKAIELGLARKKLTRQELLDRATQIIMRTRRVVALLMKEQHIKKPPNDKQQPV